MCSGLPGGRELESERGKVHGMFQKPKEMTGWGRAGERGIRDPGDRGGERPDWQRADSLSPTVPPLNHSLEWTDS